MNINKAWHEKHKMPKNPSETEKENGIWHTQSIADAGHFLKNIKLK